MASVTIKSTKQEIYDALMESEKKVKALKEQNFNPAEVAAEKANTEIVDSARESVKNNLFSEELSRKFTDLEAAIAIKSEELKDMYGIEKELQNLVVIVNAGKELSAKLDEEKAAKEAEIISMTEEMMKDFTVKKNILSEEYATLKADIRKQREREAEEYEYNLERSRNKENNDWEDEKARREAAIVELEAKAEAMLEEVSSKAAYITELEEKVNSIPKMIEDAKVEAAEAARKEEAREYGYKKTMAEKEHSYTVQRLEDKLDSLSNALEKANELNESLRAKLDNAYEQIRELATKTVESTGGVKILSNNTDARK